MEYNEEFDKLKTKVLKYILYKKRTEHEIKQKFMQENSEMLEQVIQTLKELDYIDDSKYIEKAAGEFIRINNMSIKELKYKLLSKGLDKNLVEDYIQNNQDMLTEYEQKSAENIKVKKCRGELHSPEEINQYLRKKGYNL
ncbi:MAG: RecX family transcriptional regulator [Firmicutes bacterium]|nr:RecX family transcriptional regulator [Bacillota bacterium]